MAISVEKKIKQENEHLAQVITALHDAVLQAEQEIDNYLNNNPGFQVPKTAISAYNTSSSDCKALIFRLWSNVLQELNTRYPDWKISEGPDYLLFEPRGYTRAFDKLSGGSTYQKKGV